MPGRVEGKVAIVTGGGSGFGFGIADKLSKEGGKVLIMDIAPGKAPELASRGVKFLNGDISLRKSWEDALEFCLKEWGKLDIVCNNAGILIVKLTTEFTEEEYERLFRVNVKGLFQSTQVIIPYMVKRGAGGVFVNTSSTGEPRPRPYGTWYCATKAATTNATKALAAEWAKHNIRFNSIAPSLGDTGMLGTNLDLAGLNDTPENREKMVEMVPLRRMCKASDVGNLVCFLCSDEADYITGTQVAVDGGRAI